MISRRKFVLALGAGAFATPLASFAQQPGKVWRVGFLAQTRNAASDFYSPLTRGLQELGYIVGKNLVIDWRSAEGEIERLPELAAELVRLNPDVLVAQGTPASHAAQKATTTIPIVMPSMGDPVGSGLVKSLARPGGNSTGLSFMIVELGPKHLDLLRAAVPNVTRVAVLANPSNSVSIAALKNIQIAAQKLGLKILSLEARTPQEITSALAAMGRQKAEALIVPQESLFSQQRNQIVEYAAKHRLPTIGGSIENADGGFLMSYGQNSAENFRRAATYVDKIFKGANPGDLPVEQPTVFDFGINLKTAKVLGIKIPQSILLQATKVIE